MRGNSTVEDLRNVFCLKMNLNTSETRFLLNGDRLEGKSTLQNLDMEIDDVIDVFNECIGGGPPGKKILLNSEKQILDALNDSTDIALSDEDNFEEIVDQVKSLDDKCDDKKEETLLGRQDESKEEKLSPTNEKIMKKGKQDMQNVNLCNELVTSTHHQGTSTESVLQAQQQTQISVQQPLDLVQQILIPVQHQVTAVQYPVNTSQKTGTSVKEPLTYVSQLVISPESTWKGLPIIKDKPFFTLATADTKETKIPDILDNELANYDLNDRDQENFQKFEKIDESELLKDYNSNVVTEELETSNNNDKSDEEDWLESLKLQFQKEGVAEKSSLHKKIQFYLELPQLTDSELKIVKNLRERLEVHADWELEKKKMFLPKKKKEMKRKRVEPAEINQRCLRKKIAPDEKVTGLVTAQTTSKSDNRDENSTRRLEEEDETNPNSTPKQRKHIFRMFGIVSPFIRQRVPTEEEVRRFSLAVHLWAVKVKGGVQFLQENQLTERNFQEILIFAGQSSRWKLIPDRSVIQYKNLWKNAVKGIEGFHGDRETGFETKSRLHNPSLPF